MSTAEVKKGSAAHPDHLNIRRAAVIFELSRFQNYEYLSVAELQAATPLRGPGNDHQWGFVDYRSMTEKEFEGWIVDRLRDFLAGDASAPKGSDSVEIVDDMDDEYTF